MNCKPGDLAIIVSGPNTGGLVRCIELIKPGALGDRWHVEALFRPQVNRHGAPIDPNKKKACSDANLRPIRDQDGEDQTLTWVGKPSEVTA